MDQNDINFNEIVSILLKYKKIIMLLTFITTFFSIIFVVFFKNPKPLYVGSLLVEIGEYKTAYGFKEIDYPINLKYILELEEKDNLGLSINIPHGTRKMISINVKDYSYVEIKNRIEKAYEKLIEREKEKLKTYIDYIPTKRIGEVRIKDKPVNKPKKKLIVAISFLSGLTLSIFLVFFINGIKSKEHKINDK